MVKKRILEPKSIFDEDSVFDAFNNAGIKHAHAYSMWRYIITKSGDNDALTVHDLAEQVTDFPKRATELIENEFVITTSRVIDRKDASDGSTTKLMIELQDGRRVESVIMRYGEVELRSFPEQEKNKRKILNDLSNSDANIAEDSGSIRSFKEPKKFKSNRRATLCVSSQVGCAMGCKFCATGTMGLLDNLTSGEILEQLYHANKIEKIRNIVFMGMGEPLDNYQAVQIAIRAMVDIRRFALSPARISVSTVGVVPSMMKMIKDMPDISLALSLHAPDQETRLKIVPTARIWSIDQILDASDAFIEHQNDGSIKRDLRRNPMLPDENSNRQDNGRRHVLLEYVLLGPNVNCLPEHAQKLGMLLGSNEFRLKHYKLNVIPYNPTDAGIPHGFLPPSPKIISEFVSIVRSYGVTVMIRQELGQDVDAACGQLVIQSMLDKNGGSDKCVEESNNIDMEDLGTVQRRRVFKKIGNVNKSVKVPETQKQSLYNVNKIVKLLIFALSLLLFRISWRIWIASENRLK